MEAIIDYDTRFVAGSSDSIYQTFKRSYLFPRQRIFIRMATKLIGNDRLKVVDRQMEQYSAKIGESITKLLYDKETDTKRMVTSLCTGIIGLAVATCRRQGLVQKNAKDELTAFVKREMERIRKQQQLRRSEIYKCP